MHIHVLYYVRMMKSYYPNLPTFSQTTIIMTVYILILYPSFLSLHQKQQQTKN